MFTSLDVVNCLITHLSEIDILNFTRFKTYRPLESQIIFDETLEKVFFNAGKINQEVKLPFWDSFNVSLFDNDFKNFSFLGQIQFHNGVQSQYSLNSYDVAKFLEEKENNIDLTLSSEVVLKNGQKMHLQLLDFHIPVSEKNSNICVNVIKNLNITGFLLDSGKSYHFYGEKLMDENTLVQFLAKALLFSPIIDRAWIAHQLIERKCHLRISKKYSRLPQLITRIS